MYFCSLGSEFCVSNCFFLFALNALLRFPWSASGQNIVYVLAFFQFKHPAVACVGVIILAWTLFWLLDVINAPGSTWQQLMKLQVISVCFWSGNWLWEVKCISCYFIMWKQGICLDFCVLLFRAARPLLEWTGGGRWGGVTWSLMFCGARVLQDAVQCNAAVNFWVPCVSGSHVYIVARWHLPVTWE